MGIQSMDSVRERDAAWRRRSGATEPRNDLSMPSVLQSNRREFQEAPGPKTKESPRPPLLVDTDDGHPEAGSAAQGLENIPTERPARGKLQTQLTLAFAAAMMLFGAMFTVVSCASSPAAGATLRSSARVVISLCCAATFAAWLVLGRALRPLAQLAACADELDGRWARKSLDVAGNQIEVQRARHALDQALLRLRESHEALELFVSNVAHELQDPVTTVLAEAQSLSVANQSPESLAAFARSTRAELTRIGKIISGSLTLARLDSAQEPGALDPICMLDIALDVVKQARTRAAEHDVRLVLMLPDAEQLDVRGDADLVTSMLENIVSNAVTYSPPGEEIRIQLERADERLQITVRDRGPGVPELLLPHILNAHVHGSRKSHGARGRGLGLAIATKVARYHGGAIRVANHVDGGCEVVIALPLYRPMAAQPARGKSTISAAPG